MWLIKFLGDHFRHDRLLNGKHGKFPWPLNIWIPFDNNLGLRPC